MWNGPLVCVAGVMRGWGLPVVAGGEAAECGSWREFAGKSTTMRLILALTARRLVTSQSVPLILTFRRNSYRYDFDALRTASTHVVIGVGAESGQMIAGRAGLAVAGRLGQTPVTFPGGHGGFLGGEQSRPRRSPGEAPVS